mgnify:CR=1 FL=1
MSSIIGWCRVSIIASKIFSLDFCFIFSSFALSSLSQARHGLIFWGSSFKPPIQAFGILLVLCYLICLYVWHKHQLSKKRSNVLIPQYTFAYMPSQSVFYHIGIWNLCFTKRIKHRLGTFKRVWKMSQSVDFHLSLYNLCNLRNLWICVLLPPLINEAKAKVDFTFLSSKRNDNQEFQTTKEHF